MSECQDWRSVPNPVCLFVGSFAPLFVCLLACLMFTCLFCCLQEDKARVSRSSVSNLEAATFLFVNQLFVCVLFCLCLLVLFVLLVSWFLSLASFVGQLVGCWFATRQQGSAVHCSVQMHEMPGFLDI